MEEVNPIQPQQENWNRIEAFNAGKDAVMRGSVLLF